MTAGTRSWVSHFTTAAFICAGAAVLFAIAWRFVPHHAPTRPAWLGGSGLIHAVLGLTLYLLAHLVRAARLALLISDSRVPLRRVLGAHFFASGSSLLLPFKLGEILRLSELNRLVDSPARSLMLVWMERLLDLVVIVTMMTLAVAAAPSVVSAIFVPLTLSVLFILGTVLLFLVFPENAESLKLFIIRRYHAPWTLPVLQVIHGAQHVVAQAPALVSKRVITIVLLTLVVWLLEVQVLGLFLPPGMTAMDTTLLAVTYLFSQLLLRPGASVTQLLQPVTLTLTTHAEAVASALTFYQFGIQLTLLGLSGTLFLLTVRNRIRLPVRVHPWLAT